MKGSWRETRRRPRRPTRTSQLPRRTFRRRRLGDRRPPLAREPAHRAPPRNLRRSRSMAVGSAVRRPDDRTTAAVRWQCGGSACSVDGRIRHLGRPCGAQKWLMQRTSPLISTSSTNIVTRSSVAICRPVRQRSAPAREGWSSGLKAQRSPQFRVDCGALGSHPVIQSAGQRGTRSGQSGSRAAGALAGRLISGRNQARSGADPASIWQSVARRRLSWPIEGPHPWRMGASYWRSTSLRLSRRARLTAGRRYGNHECADRLVSPHHAAENSSRRTTRLHSWPTVSSDLCAFAARPLS